MCAVHCIIYTEVGIYATIQSRDVRPRDLGGSKNLHSNTVHGNGAFFTKCSNKNKLAPSYQRAESSLVYYEAEG